MAAVCFESTNQAVLEQVLSTDHSGLDYWHGHFSYGSGTQAAFVERRLMPKLHSGESAKTGYPDSRAYQVPATWLSMSGERQRVIKAKNWWKIKGLQRYRS